MSSLTVQQVPENLRRFKRYPAFKDSGVEWLGEIPAHWIVAPLYARYQVALGKMLDSKRMTGEHSSRYVRNVDVQWDTVNTADLPEMDFAPWERDRYLLREGDLLVCEGGEVGRAAIWPGASEDCFYQKAVHRVRPRSPEESPRFLFYVLQSLAKGGVFAASGNPNTIDHLTAVQLRHHRISFPAASEQITITAFLDREVGKIDVMLAKKKRLIELLQEKRTALIIRAVTRGLDPTVPLKDSGVEWMGEIPAHWETRRVRDIAVSLQTGPFGSQLHADEYLLGGIPVINPSNLREGELVEDPECTVGLEAALRLAPHRLRQGDILLARRGELGRCGLVNQHQEGWLCGTGCLNLRLKPALVHPRYLIYVIGTRGVAEWLELHSVGATMQNLNTSIIGRLPIGMPPATEQAAVVGVLDRETARVDTLIARVREAIDRLKELRTALVSAAVTGKIDVREEAA